jgi:DNA-binding MarR family transcriptional regulator
MDHATLFADLVFAEVRLLDLVNDRLESEIGLGVTSYLPLQVVGAVPNCRVQDVAHELGISVGGASKAVDRLELARLCRRRRHPTDRRSSIVLLTAAGRRTLASGQSVTHQVLAETLGLSASRQLALGNTLSTLRQTLQGG